MLRRRLFVLALLLVPSWLATPARAVACSIDTDCSSGQWCNEGTGMCVATLPNGAAIPNDPPHTAPTLNGTCTAAAGALVCQSGVCDVNDNRCGLANGDGPCTIGNGSTVCRSAACSTDGKCEPVGGCNVDADCSGGQWCSESTATCMAKLPNGSPIPNDPVHSSPTLNGTCTAAAGILVCQSGVCDASDNGCGFANGDGPCTVGNGSVVCRSATCSVNGTCESAGGCNVDADCPVGDICGPGQICILGPTPTPTSTPGPTSTPDGFIPPDTNTLSCEKSVSKQLGKLAVCIRNCHFKAATEAFKGTPFDEEACAKTTPKKSCRAKYDTAAQKILAKSICPACLDAGHQSALADRVEGEIESETGDLYCEGTTPLPQ